MDKNRIECGELARWLGVSRYTITLWRNNDQRQPSDDVDAQLEQLNTLIEKKGVVRALQEPREATAT